jgi:hypothetical protein
VAAPAADRQVAAVVRRAGLTGVAGSERLRTVLPMLLVQDGIEV